MSTLQLQAYEMLSKLRDKKVQLLIDLMKNFMENTDAASSSAGTKRIGIAKGEFIVPEDIDECNDIIADMFGVNE